MDDERLACIEYDSLYKEIDKHSDRISTIVNFDVVAVAAILGFVPQLEPEAMNVFGIPFSTRSFFLLLPLVILLPSFVLVTSELNSIVRIGAYIHVFYERRTTSIAWQKAIQSLRVEPDKGFLAGLPLLLKRDKKLRPARFLRNGLRFLLTALAAFSIVLSVMSAITFSAKTGNVWSLFYMLGIWVIAAWFVAMFTMLLGKTWTREYFNEYITCLEELWPARRQY